MAFDGSDNIGTTVSSAEAFFKSWYKDRNQLNELMYADDPVMMRIRRLPATQVVAGDEIVVPLKIGRSPSQSKDFSKAQAQAKARTAARGRWVVPIDSDFGVARVSNKAIKASKNQKGAFIKLLIDETDMAIMSLRQKRCTGLFASTASSVGTISAVSTANKTITMSDVSMVTGLDINDQITLATAAGAERSSGTATTVTKVNRSNGVVTVNANITGAAANDVVYREGDFGETGLTSFLKWLPKTSPPGTLHGLDRNQDPVRLGGFSLAMVAADTFIKVVRKMASKIMNLTGSVPTALYVNPLVEDLIAQEQAASGNLRLDMSSGGAMALTKIGMGKLAFRTSMGDIDIVASPFVPIAEMLLVDERTWGLYYLGEEGDDFVDFAMNPAGGYIINAHDAPGVEVRVESFGNLICSAPGKNARITLDTARVTSANA